MDAKIVSNAGQVAAAYVISGILESMAVDGYVSPAIQFAAGVATMKKAPYLSAGFFARAATNGIKRVVKPTSGGALDLALPGSTQGGVFTKKLGMPSMNGMGRRRVARRTLRGAMGNPNMYAEMLNSPNASNGVMGLLAA